MLRLFVSAVGFSVKSAINVTTNLLGNKATTSISPVTQAVYKCYSTAFRQNAFQNTGGSLLYNPSLIQTSNEINSRNVIKFSIRKGRRKTVRTVLKRFYRLHWGGWIRTIAGRHRRLWSKSPQRRLRMKHHVLCNATQCTLLDKMVGSYWRKPKYYVDDPYEPYHTREEFRFTYKKPKPYFPPENK